MIASNLLSTYDLAIDPPADGCITDPMAWFDAPGPFELEVGCGKGGFLLDRARAHPDRRFLGIEWANKYFRICADRMARWAMDNVRVMRTDAARLVTQHLPPRCVSLLHLYHPDPWPKRRHHKRRLVQAPFVEALCRVLTPAGGWIIQSDHREYFDRIQWVLGKRSELKRIPWEVAGGRWKLLQSPTNYEIKYRREGRPIFRAAYLLDPGSLREPHA